jgi:hypothetical protein
MVRRMVRFFLGSHREGLAQEGHTHQQEGQQGSPGEPAVASHTNAIVARYDLPRLPEMTARGYQGRAILPWGSLWGRLSGGPVCLP